MRADQKRVYNYLKRKKRMISGLTIKRQLGVPLKLITELQDISGIGSFGPAGMKKTQPHQRIRYAKSNSFFATIGNIVKWKGRLYMTAERPLRKGIWTPPRRKSSINKKENHVQPR